MKKISYYLAALMPHLTISGFVLDEKLQRNTSKFAIFLEQEIPNSFFFHFEIFWICYYGPAGHPVHYNKSKVARNEKRKNNIWLFLFQKYGILANFEAFLWSFQSSINPEIVRSDASLAPNSEINSNKIQLHCSAG